MAAAKDEVIQLSGVLDIRQAESLHEKLKSVKSTKRSVILDLQEAEDIDLSITQLIFSFKKSLIEEKRTVSIRNANDKIMERISLCDFNELLQES